MKIEFLKLQQFRNYAEKEFNFDENVNLILGRNGRGKSNIIEAIQILLTGKSFRYASPENLIRHDDYSEYATIQLKVTSRQSADLIKCNISQNQQFKFSLNEKAITGSNLVAKFGSVLFCPESLSVIKQGPEERRAFIDQMVAAYYPNGSQLLRENEKCQKTKARVLKDYGKRLLNLNETMAILESLEPSLLLVGTQLSLARIFIMKSLLKSANHYAKINLKNTNVDISVEYVISSQSAIDWSENQVYDALKDRIKELRESELRLGKSLVGPHRHEIRFCFNGKDARQFCSQGQQRAVILAFKLAQVMYHKELRNKYPVLLLDDVFSEFDQENRSSLLNFLRTIPAQKFISATEIDQLEQEAFKAGSIKEFRIESN